MREKALRDNTRGFFAQKQLCDSANRACAFASAAVNAQISVNFALAVSVQRDSAQGASVYTSTAAYAQILINGMSHNKYLHIIMVDGVQIAIRTHIIE